MRVQARLISGDGQALLSAGELEETAELWGLRDIARNHCASVYGLNLSDLNSVQLGEVADFVGAMIVFFEEERADVD